MSPKIRRAREKDPKGLPAWKRGAVGILATAALALTSLGAATFAVADEGQSADGGEEAVGMAARSAGVELEAPEDPVDEPEDVDTPDVPETPDEVTETDEPEIDGGSADLPDAEEGLEAPTPKKKAPARAAANAPSPLADEETPTGTFSVQKILLVNNELVEEGEVTETFPVTATWTDEEGDLQTETFDLVAGEDPTESAEIPVGTTVTITEDAPETILALGYVLQSSEIDPAQLVIEADAIETVTVTNHYVRDLTGAYTNKKDQSDPVDWSWKDPYTSDTSAQFTPGTFYASTTEDYLTVGFERPNSSGSVGWIFEFTNAPERWGYGTGTTLVPQPDRSEGGQVLSIGYQGTGDPASVYYCEYDDLADYPGTCTMIPNEVVIKDGLVVELKVPLEMIGQGEPGCPPTMGATTYLRSFNNLKGNPKADNPNLQNWAAPVGFRPPSTCAELTLIKKLDQKYDLSKKPEDWTVTATPRRDLLGQEPITGDGKATSTQVKPGNYVLEESANPKGWRVKTDWKCVSDPGSPYPEHGDPDEKGYWNLETFEDKDAGTKMTVLSLGDNARVTCTIENKDLPGSVVWSKVDEDGNALNGSEWSLTGPDNLELPGDCGPDVPVPIEGAYCLVSGSDFEVGRLKWGEYTLTETKAPEGYEIPEGGNTESFTVRDEEEKRIYTFGPFVNERSVGELTITKAFGVPAPKLSEDEDVVFSGTYTCEKEGEDYPDITGEWSVSGSDVLAGHGEATLTPDDEEGMPAADAIPHGYECVVVETAPAVGSSGGLPNSSWAWVSPTYDPEGEEGGEVTIKAGETSGVTVTNNAERVYGEFQITKTIELPQGETYDDNLQFGGTWTCVTPDVDEADITGTWSVTGERTQVVKQDGSEPAKQIPLGSTCTATETQPTGGPIAEKPWIQWDGHTVSLGVEAAKVQSVDTTITVTNKTKVVLGSVRWYKVDDSTPAKPLAGSEWKLTGPAGFTEKVQPSEGCSEDPEECILTGGPEFSLGDLIWGEYTLVETKAPAGYKPSHTEYKFTIWGPDELSGQLTVGDEVVVGNGVVNERLEGPTLPLTGGASAFAFLVAGGGLAAIAAAAGVLRSVRRRVS